MDAYTFLHFYVKNVSELLYTGLDHVPCMSPGSAFESLKSSTEGMNSTQQRQPSRPLRKDFLRPQTASKGNTSLKPLSELFRG